MSDALKRKIAALRAKTASAGCTEAEALAAAELAARLMKEHGLDEADLVMTEAAAPEITSRPTWRATLVAAIAHCTNTAVILVRDAPRQGNAFLFIGRAPGPEVAVYLREVTFRAVAAEVVSFKTGLFYRRRRSLATRRQAVADFTGALVDRLCRRLFELFGPTIDAPTREAAMLALVKRFPDTIDHAPGQRETRYSEAAAQGWRAGGNVPLNRGVDGGRAPLTIGGGRE